MKKKMLLIFVLGMIFSELSGIYARVRFENWVKVNGPTQGMPMTADILLAELFNTPLETLYYWNEEIWESK